MKSKTFKTIDEQIEILKAKGLVIEDLDFAKQTLLRENYFFINGYRHLFLKSETDRIFLKGTTFKEIHCMFSFDRQLRNIIFKNILVVENNLKSITAYIMSKNHGFKENSYLNNNNYVRDSKKNRQINDLIRKMKRQIRINGKQHTATAHYIDSYGYIPLWIAVKVLSFGIISELFTILQYEDQKEISEIFDVDIDNLVEFLPILANYRNLCAHEDICYLNKTQKRIPETKYHRLLNIEKDEEGDYVCGQNDLFALIIILKHLLDKGNFNLFMREIDYELDYLAGRLHVIDIDKVLKEMGFPSNYKDIVRLD